MLLETGADFNLQPFAKSMAVARNFHHDQIRKETKFD